MPLALASGAAMSSILLTPAGRQPSLGWYRRSADPNVRVLSRPRSTLRQTAQGPNGKSALTWRMVELRRSMASTANAW